MAAPNYVALLLVLATPSTSAGRFGWWSAHRRERKPPHLATVVAAKSKGNAAAIGDLRGGGGAGRFVELPGYALTAEEGAVDIDNLESGQAEERVKRSQGKCASPALDPTTSRTLMPRPHPWPLRAHPSAADRDSASQTTAT